MVIQHHPQRAAPLERRRHHTLSSSASTSVPDACMTWWSRSNSSASTNTWDARRAAREPAAAGNEGARSRCAPMCGAGRRKARPPAIRRGFEDPGRCACAAASGRQERRRAARSASGHRGDSSFARVQGERGTLHPPPRLTIGLARRANGPRDQGTSGAGRLPRALRAHTGLMDEDQATITPYKDGPYIVRGNFLVTDQDGNTIDARRKTVGLRLLCKSQSPVLRRDAQAGRVQGRRGPRGDRPASDLDGEIRPE